MLNITQSSNVGALEFTVNKTTGEVSGTRFYADGAPKWSELPFLNEALFDAFANQNWKSINEALAKSQVPADVYGAVYNHLDKWGDTPRGMNQALVYICRLIKELAQRGLAFSDSLLRVYGYAGMDSTKNWPLAQGVDVYVLLRRNMQLDYVTADYVPVSVRLDTTIDGKVSVTIVNGYDNVYLTYDRVEYVTEYRVERALLDAKADDKTAKHLAAAVNRMIWVNPDRFRPQD